MQQIEWIFSGIGTQIIVWIVSIIISGVIGYKIGIHKNVGKQVQKADYNVAQEQMLSVEDDTDDKSTLSKSSLVQKQIAGSGSKQTQIGEIKRGHK